ncbi:hypothetical protein THICB2_210007 [Thiomonas sp. CB2]|nr:hypothetical protein THICB2_210007 [Thiomonas sp. CB2]VDY05822.1 protein of unknown function [Thiomonas sp. Bio17B3]VDY10880.1 protein of unknown function [Thiomonas sp. Sup16B3]VDY14081.1 conserved protein of unknown function [Thiomonas sp. OC7]VDY16725.1 protein of unknown function [Thiomonas sp. CB2]
MDVFFPIKIPDPFNDFLATFSPQIIVFFRAIDAESFIKVLRAKCNLFKLCAALNIQRRASPNCIRNTLHPDCFFRVDVRVFRGRATVLSGLSRVFHVERKVAAVGTFVFNAYAKTLSTKH